jgi:nucleotidyltransferase substrate binding protein (TIGR01987 family)
VSERFEQQRMQFEKALSRLQEALLENESGIVRDAIIQRFEFTFEMAWRTMHRWLSDRGERVPLQAFAVLPAAHAARLLEEPDVWDQIRHHRNETSHTYDESKAIEVAAFVRAVAEPAFATLLPRLQDP